MKWGVYREERGWLIDTCAGMTWSWNVNEAVWYDTVREAIEAIRAADASEIGCQFLRLK